METPEDIKEQEETNVADLLLADEQEENAGEDEIHEDEIELREGETIEELKARITKRNHSLRKSKEANSRMQEELKELREELSKIKEYGNRQKPDPGNDQKEAEKRAEYEREMAEKINDDPSIAIKYINESMNDFETRVASYIGNQVSELKEMINELKKETNPDIVQNRKEIDSLKEKLGVPEMDDNTALNLLSVLKNKKTKVPRGTVGGGKARIQNEPKKVELSEEALQKMGY